MTVVPNATMRQATNSHVHRQFAAAGRTFQNPHVIKSNIRINATSMSASQNETDYVSSKLSLSVNQDSVNVQRNLAQSMKLKAAMTN